MENKFVIKRGYISQGDSSITGSLVVTEGITGSLQGTASFATTASVNTNGNPLIGGSITSGQVAFGTAAGVIGGDSGLFWDNTNKRLGVGTATPVVQLESVKSLNGFECQIQARNSFSGGGSFGGIGFGVSSATFVNNTGYIGVLRSVGGDIPQLIFGVAGTVTSGNLTHERMRINGGTGNILINTTTDAGFRLNVNGTARFGATTIQAPGALSTDIAFRVRNSADTRDLINIRGNKTIELIADTPATNGGISISAASVYNEPIINTYDGFGTNIMRFDSSARVIGINGSGNIRIGSFSGNGYLGMVTPTSNNRFLKLVDAFGIEYLSIGGNTFDGGGGISMTVKTTTDNGTNFINFSRSNNTNQFVISDQANVGIGGTTFGTSSKFVISQFTGTAPTTSPADAFQQYSADITAGNAAPHFRTENGSIIKLYQQSAVTSSQGLADVLTNVGLLATGSSIATAFERLSDFQSPYHYSGNATLGTSTSSTSWIINRIDFTTPGSPITLQGTGSWDNRTSLIYS
jgi:hypothetical protein